MNSLQDKQKQQTYDPRILREGKLEGEWVWNPYSIICRF